jgi:hypothetical protein
VDIAKEGEEDGGRKRGGEGKEKEGLFAQVAE